MDRKKRVVGEICSLLGFIMGISLLFQEFVVPKITGHAIAVVTVNATAAFMAETLTICSIALFLFFRLNR